MNNSTAISDHELLLATWKPEGDASLPRLAGFKLEAFRKAFIGVICVRNRILDSINCVLSRRKVCKVYTSKLTMQNRYHTEPSSPCIWTTRSTILANPNDLTAQEPRPLQDGKLYPRCYQARRRR
jgi:hypothetical protein